MFRNNNLFIRTNDPIYSFAVAGKEKNFFTNKYFDNGFGKDSIFELFDKNKSLIIMINTQSFTLFHYYEQFTGCPFRYLKKFNGKVVFNNKDINSYNYELNVKYLDINVVNSQDKHNSFLNKYIDNNLISRYEIKNNIIIDFINLPKIRSKLINDLVLDPFLCLRNKPEVKLYCSNKII